MIPLARRTTTRRLGTTSVSYSRQSLPRPSRFYSTPTKRANAPAAVAPNTAPQSDYPAFLPQAQDKPPSTAAFESTFHDMESFLARRVPYAILPTPLPDDRSSPLNDINFPQSSTVDQVAVIDACLHNLHDVPRAQEIFSRLIAERPGDPMLSIKIHNALMAAYLEMATTKEPEKATEWIESLAGLYDSIEGHHSQIKPSANTFGTMLLAWQRFNPDSERPLSTVVDLPDPKRLLRAIVDTAVPVSTVVADRAFKTSEESSEAIRDLSKAAVELNMSWIITELGTADLMGRQTVDPLENVPEASPVLRLKKKDPIVSPDGTIVAEENEEPEYEVPFNLATLRKHLAQVAMARKVLPDDASARQKLLEESVYDVAAERLKHQAKLFEELGIADKGLNNQDLRAWMWNWHVKLQERIKAEVAGLLRSEANVPASKAQTRLGPYMTLVKPEKLSLITILEIMHLQSSGGIVEGMKTARALISIGKAVEMEYKAQMCRKNHISVPASGPRVESGFFNNLGYRDLHARRVAARKYMEDAEEWTAEWTQTARVRVGSLLVECLMDEATVMRYARDQSGELISEEQPAFFHSYEYVRGQRLGVIKLNTVVAERIAKDQLRETLHPRHLPMLIKPKPWLSHDQGGYLYNKSVVMRYKECMEQLSYIKEASALGNLELVYASMDVLSSTPWRINRDVFDVVLQVWNSGQRLGKLPPAEFDEPEPERPEHYDSDPKARTIYLMRQKQYINAKANNHSDRCNVNYKIEIARTFLGDTIYMPHNLDFRGRAYPIPPHLNHIGDDLSRGLLKFGEARPLGETGLRWLKIHCANLYGYDKGTFEERVQFVHDHLDDIYDSADHPLDGRGWWKDADDPWQCLATCKELKAALESGNPTAFMSDLPVHQDGTCNGLQHYAALGGDAQGARQVNLSVTDKPSDVYTYVADMVQKSMQEDIANGDKYAAMLDGKIARKVVKQTVMTTVYGVTFIGAREQIERQLKDRGDVPVEEAWGASAYLARKVLGCIGDLFSGAKAIQTWLNMSARLIAKSIPPERFEEAMTGVITPPKLGRMSTKPPVSRLKKEQMTSVIWTTPLGLPIVQPYRQTKRKQINTHVQSVYISDPNSPSAVNSQKQASAFPPNFIHSLDATHMMLTALECRSREITFAAVHDSYWTHACSVSEMSEIIRDTFIALHSSDVLGKLDQEIRERYKGYKIPLSSLRVGRLWAQLGLSPDGVSAVKTVDVLPKLIAIAASKGGSLAEKTAAATEVLAQHDALDVSPTVRGRGRPKKAKPAKEEIVEEDEDEHESDSTRDEFDGRFVELVDILPEVPKKGEFDVNTIKRSLYFFS